MRNEVVEVVRHASHSAIEMHRKLCFRIVLTFAAILAAVPTLWGGRKYFDYITVEPRLPRGIP
jgi:hypothetical protein